jgi:outer membrane receptor protein involved in Fe transport
VPFDGAYFQPAYDSLMTVYGLHLEGQWSPGKHFHAGAAVTYNMYETSTLPEYFHATPLRADVFGTYIWNERLTARAELNFYSNTPTALDSRGEVLKRSSFLNVGLGGEYRIIDGLSVYVSLNNLLGTEFTRWHNYPERPLDISGGVSYTF